MSANVSRVPSLVSQSCSSRIPGVSIRRPESGNTMSCRAVLVAARGCPIRGPLRSGADRGRRADSRWSIFRHPDDPSNAPVCPNPRYWRSTSTSPGTRQDTRAQGPPQRTRGRFRPCLDVARHVRFVQHHDGSRPAVGRHEQVALDPSRVEITVQTGHKKHGVDVGGDDLLFGWIAGRAPREPASARKHAQRFGCHRNVRQLRATQSPMAGKSARPEAR